VVIVGVRLRTQPTLGAGGHPQVPNLTSRWREMRACNDNACEESRKPPDTVGVAQGCFSDPHIQLNEGCA
jgi:hypothetical protein